MLGKSWTVSKTDVRLELGKHQLALTSEFVTLRDPLQYFCHLSSSVKCDTVQIPKGKDMSQRSLGGASEMSLPHSELVH